MRIRYGLQWPDELDDLKVEMHCIRSGGIWKQSGMTVGNGLSFHYERMRQILWPHLDDHRWNSLCRDEIIKNKVTVLMGCASSGKTHAAAWVYLCEYFCFPEDTCVLVSSTDIRGLELRVWGEIKNLHEQAKANYEYLPGYLIDSKHCISSDSIDEGQARDLRRGLIGIPTISNGKYIGLSKWVGVKQKRMRLIADECFPAGTMIDTPSGKRPIESLVPGDSVINAIGVDVVIGTLRKFERELYRITSSDGRVIICTGNHPILTQKGWIEACKLTRCHYMVSPYEAMQVLQNTDKQYSFLQQELRRKMGNVYSTGSGQILHSGAREKDQHIEICHAQKQTGDSHSHAQAHVASQSDPYAGCRGENKGQPWHEAARKPEETLRYAQSSRRSVDRQVSSLHGANLSRKDSFEDAGEGFGVEFCDLHQKETRNGLSVLLQSGRCNSVPEAGSGSGRPITFGLQESSQRPKEGCAVVGSWVDSCEVLEQGDFEQLSGGKKEIEVYNLHVKNHHSYSVNGIQVANCQFMGASFLSAFSNLDKNEDFRAIVLGNPNDIMDPLGKAAEPREGWASHLEPTKTEVWDTRFMNGRCVNLIGLDSPNFDYPANEPTRFKYLISREKIANTLSFFPKDSIEYYSQCVGAMKIGVLARRVLTRDMCRQFHACEPVIWKGTPTVKIGALDAAYGGDRCVLGCIEFGEDARGRQTIMVYPPVIVPVSVKVDKIPEDQIADYVRLYCDSRGIKPENFFYDSTGRGSLGTSFARIWSNKVNPLEFGGTPTDRPVASDLYIQDAKGGRRLKLCSEHYRKFVTELWFSVRYAIEADQMRGLSEDVMEEGCMREWDTTKDDKKELETKIKMKERTGRSPDLMDQLAIAVEGARQRGFQIRMLVNTVARSANAIEDFLDAKRKKHKELQKKQQLNYA